MIFAHGYDFVCSAHIVYYYHLCEVIFGMFVQGKQSLSSNYVFIVLCKMEQNEFRKTFKIFKASLYQLKPLMKTTKILTTMKNLPRLTMIVKPIKIHETCHQLNVLVMKNKPPCWVKSV